MEQVDQKEKIARMDNPGIVTDGTRTARPSLTSAAATGIASSSVTMSRGPLGLLRSSDDVDGVESDLLTGEDVES